MQRKEMIPLSHALVFKLYFMLLHGKFGWLKRYDNNFIEFNNVRATDCLYSVRVDEVKDAMRKLGALGVITDIEFDSGWTRCRWKEPNVGCN